jgi:hypothetical protein
VLEWLRKKSADCTRGAGTFTYALAIYGKFAV